MDGKLDGLAPFVLASALTLGGLGCDHGDALEAGFDDEETLAAALEADDHFTRGMQAGDGGRWDEAVSQLSACLESAPDHGPARRQRGWARYQTGDFEGAIEDLLACAAADPRDASVYQDAWRAAYRVEGERAAEFLVRWLERQDVHTWRGSVSVLTGDERQEVDGLVAARRDALSYVNRANWRWLEEYRDEALVDVREALKLDPELAPAHYFLGRMYEEGVWISQFIVRPRFDAAAASYRRALETGLGGSGLVHARLAYCLARTDDPGFFEAVKAGAGCAFPTLDNLYALAGAQLIQGDDEGARATLERCAERGSAVVTLRWPEWMVGPETAEPMSSADWTARAASSPPHPMSIYDSLLRKDPERPVLNFLLGNVLADQGRQAEAFEYFDLALEADSDFTISRLALALAHHGIGQLDEAVEELEACLESDKPALVACAQGWLADVFETRGDLEAEERAWRAALEHRPDYTAAMDHLGVAAMDSGDHAGCVKMMTGLLRTPDGKGRWSAYSARGRSRAELGDHAGGVLDLDRAIAIYPGQNAYLYLFRGRVHGAAGNTHAAVDDFVNAFRIYPDGEPGREAKDELAALETSVSSETCGACSGRGIFTCDGCNGAGVSFWNDPTGIRAGEGVKTCGTCVGGGTLTCDTCRGAGFLVFVD